MSIPTACWNASLNLLIRRFKPLAASTHKKNANKLTFLNGRADRIASPSTHS